MSSFLASIVICTHNPRVASLGETLSALQAQSLPRAEWELLLVDNASKPGTVDPTWVDWHPNGRLVEESMLGLTPARLRGIRESRSDLIVFVDDDNILASDYLAQAVAIARAHPFIGAFGGRIDGRYEAPPPAWAADYLGYLAIIPVDEPMWSNAVSRHPCCPSGAGMCVRRNVAEKYARIVQNDPARRALDRIGENLSSCGDSDLALTACDLGLGAGRFPQLRLEHIIPAGRVQLAYLCALVHGIHRSQAILSALRGHPPTVSRSGRAERLIRAWREFTFPPEIRQLRAAAERGRREGAELAAQLDHAPSRA